MNHFWGNSRGQSLSEYLIVVIVIALAVIVAIRYFGGSIKGQVEDVVGTVNDPSKDNRRESLLHQDEIKTHHAIDAKNEFSESDEVLPENDLASGFSNHSAFSKDAQSQEAEELSKQVKRFSRGVGDSEETENIALDRSFGFGGVIAALCVFLCFIWGIIKAFGKKSKKLKKKRRLWFFTLGGKNDDVK